MGPARKLAPVVLAFLGGIHGASACEPQADAGRDVLTTSISGRVGGSGLEDPQYVLSFPPVQNLVMCAVRGPVDAEVAERMLKEVPVAPEDLVALGLLRQSAGRYQLSYPVLTVEDQERITKVARKASESLGREFEARGEAISDILARYPHAELRDELAFALVAGMLLNWEGLQLSTRLGYRTEPSETSGGGRYLVRSHETGYEGDSTSLYWGSHTFPGPRMSLSTFGDSHSIPRIKGLPDVLTEPVENGLELLSGDPQLYSAAMGVFLLNVTESLTDAGDVMARLAESPAPAAELDRIGIPESRLKATLSLLEATGYVVQKDDGYRIAVPVLLEEHEPMVAELLNLGRDVLTEWLKTHHDNLRRDLVDLSPMQHDIAFEHVFNDVWHEILGWTTRMLAQQDLYQDPRESGYRYRGYVPLVWASSLHEFGASEGSR